MLMFRPFVKYADFSGRAQRAEYWLFQLFQVLACLALMAFMVTGVFRGSSMAGALAGGLAGMGLIGLLVLACILPNLAVTVRRLHDSGKSAWWMLLYAPGIVSWGNNFKSLALLATPQSAHRTSDFAAMAGQSAMIGLVAMLANLALFILMCWPGTRGTNRFGPDPKGDGTDTTRTFDEPDSAPRPTNPDLAVFDLALQPQSRAPQPQSYAQAPYTPPSRPAPPPFSTARPAFGKRR